ncbi:hypothetical protein F4604DRAFT_1718231 [Suillus subluteus]|nr:hypothetical protein F4604DRAFT_1718231 [Suillus subluteus]
MASHCLLVSMAFIRLLHGPILNLMFIPIAVPFVVSQQPVLICCPQLLPLSLRGCLLLQQFAELACSCFGVYWTGLCS